MNYNDRNWKLLTNYLKTADGRKKIHLINRAQLMMDAITFHENDLLSLEPVLDFIEGLKFETEFAVYNSGLLLTSWMNDTLLDTEYHVKFQLYVDTRLLYELCAPFIYFFSLH